MFPAVDVVVVAEECKIPLKDIYQALGYLTTWGSSTFNKVQLFIQSDGEITALYTVTDPEDNKRFVIGAVWHDGHYGFHS
jgi:hypothetical protein